MSSKRRNWKGRKGRKLSFEGLESRQMLASYTVRLATDVGDESVVNSLSWAIDQANTIAGGPHTINFELNGGASQIQVTGQVTTIKASMTIDGTLPGGAPVLLLKGGTYVGNGLEIDGSLTGGGTIEIRDLAISSFARNGIQVLAMGANDVVRIDNTSVHHNTMVGIRVGQTMVASSRVLITGNDIWANGTAGIVAESAANVTQLNQHSISGNEIGLGGSLGNFGPGVVLGVNARNYSVTNNTFNGNTGDAISLSMDAKGQNDLTENKFIGNGGIPIDLNDDGSRSNDNNDIDTGPNNLQNYPVIDGARIGFNGTHWTLPITIDAEATLNSSQYSIQIYKVNPATKEYTRVYTTANKTVPASGDLQFTETVPVNLGGGNTLNPGDRITALLMNNTTGNSLRYNTSEFPETPIVLDVAPRVVDVRLSGVQPGNTPWALPAYSFSTLAATGKLLDSIFTSGVNKIEVEFSEPVTVTGNPLTILSSAGNPVTATYQGLVGNVATWTISGQLQPDKYVILLNSSAIKDAAGKALDGDWDRPVDDMDVLAGPTDIGPDWNNDQVKTFAPGDGTPTGDFRLHFAYLPGDYNQDGRVEPGETGGDGDGDNNSGQTGDANVVTNAINTGKTRLAAGRFRGDYNDNEIVDQGDYLLWKMYFGTADLRADGNGDGSVNSADYNPWRDNLGSISSWSEQFGSGSGGGSGGGGIPVFDPFNVPRVANVTISSSLATESWQLPYSFNGHVGSGDQLRTVPVGGADTISITFTEDVNIVASDLRLVGLRTANRPTLAEFHYDVGTMTGIWRFTGWALGDHYQISLSDAVTDIEGNALDGEWTNPASLFTTNAAVSEFPSGNGYAGGDFNFVATLLPGDANLDLIVDSADFAIWSSLLGADGIFQDGDFDGDGIITNSDGDLWYQYSGYNLQNLELLADLNGDWHVDDADATILYDNYLLNLPNPTQAQGNLDGDADIDIHDLDLMFAQYGLELAVIS